MGQNESYVKVLIETLEKKTVILNQILELTKQQEILSNESVYSDEAMADLLNKKEIQIANLNKIDEGFDSVYSRVRTEVREHKDQYKNEILSMQNLIRECTDIGNTIQVLEQRNHMRFSQIFTTKHKEYSASKTKTAVASNYLKTMNNTKIMDAYFVDQKK